MGTTFLKMPHFFTKPKSHELLVLSLLVLSFFISKWFHLVYIGFVEIAFTSSIIAKSYCR